MSESKKGRRKPGDVCEKRYARQRIKLLFLLYLTTYAKVILASAKEKSSQRPYPGKSNENQKSQCKTLNDYNSHGDTSFASQGWLEVKESRAQSG